MLYHNGYTYMLHTNATVRQNVEHVGRADDGIPHVPVHVLSESVLDLESNQRATQCEVRVYFSLNSVFRSEHHIQGHLR